MKIEAWGKYTNPTSNSSNIAGFASALLAAFGVPAPAGGETATISSALNTWGGLVAAGSGGSNGSGPKAFVNIIVFDKNYKLLDAAWDGVNPAASQVGVTPVVPHDYMMQEYTIKEEGYVFMYVSNENTTLADMYFDDIAMTHTKGNVIQYNEYYPYGLQTANSWTRENTTGNNFLYNGPTETNTTTGLIETYFRGYNPALGRFLQVDPLAHLSSSLNPYQYAYNNPVNLNDPLGLDAEFTWDDFWNVVQGLMTMDYGGHWDRDQWASDMAGGYGGSCPGCSAFTSTDVSRGSDGTVSFYGTTRQSYYSNYGNMAGSTQVVVIQVNNRTADLSSLGMNGSIDLRAFNNDHSMNPTTFPAFITGSLDLAGNIANYQYLNGLAKVSDPALLGKFTKGTGILGGGLTIASAYVENQRGTFNTHTIVDVGVGVGTFLAGATVATLGAAGAIASAPVWLTGLAVGGLVYGVASAAGLSNAIDDWTNDAGKKWWYTDKN